MKTLNLKIVLFFAGYVFTSSSIIAQNWCATSQVSIQNTQENNFNNYVINFQLSGGYLNTDIKIIPTVIHIIYRNTADSTKMSMTRINNVINKCNQQLRRLNADTTQTRIQFKPVAADCHIQVCLATKKPNGSIFSGAIYHHRPNWDSFTDYSSFVNTNILDNSKYLNVFVTPEEESGVAVFPWEANSSSDGFLVGSKLFGVNEPDMANWGSEGTTFVHELAHYLGVYHTFHNSSFYLGQCESAIDNTIGDRCSDTPLDWDFPFSAAQCNDGIRPCNNPNQTLIAQTENYMYYNEDNCTNMFSKNQRTRMRACLSNLRANLVTPENLNFTGINCVPLLTINKPKSNNSFIIYPNPSNGSININSSSNAIIEKINIYNHLRQKLYTNYFNKYEISIDISALINGIYYVEIESKNEKTIKKVIKN